MHPDSFQKSRTHCSPQDSPVRTRYLGHGCTSSKDKHVEERAGNSWAEHPCEGPERENQKGDKATRPQEAPPGLRGCYAHLGSRQAPSHGKRHRGPRNTAHGGTPEVHCWKHCANERVNAGQSGRRAPGAQGLLNTSRVCSLNPAGARPAGATVFTVVPTSPKKPRGTGPWPEARGGAGI